MQLSDLQTYVRQRLTISTDESATTTQITTAINQARYRLAAKYRLLIAETTLDYAADTASVTIPSDVIEILSIRDGNYVLQPVSDQERAGFQASTADIDLTSGPSVYVRDGSAATIRVCPVPTETETGAATLRYVQRPTALSAAGDTPSELPADFHDLIGEHAVYRLALNEEDEVAARSAWRIIYGDPSNPADQGLEGELRGYMARSAGRTVARIRLQGFGR